MHSVLIIDDDEDYRELLEFSFSNKDYQVQVAPRAKNGLALLAKNEVELIICDVLMPEMDGLEFLVELKKTNVQAKIIMMSGGGVERNKLYLENTSAMGCDAVIGKPFHMVELETLIKSIL